MMPLAFFLAGLFVVLNAVGFIIVDPVIMTMEGIVAWGVGNFVVMLIACFVLKPL